MNVKTVVLFRCFKCRDIHHSQDSAHECCDGTVLSIIRHLCGRCSEIFHCEQDAEDCCREEGN